MSAIGDTPSQCRYAKKTFNFNQLIIFYEPGIFCTVLARVGLREYKPTYKSWGNQVKPYLLLLLILLGLNQNAIAEEQLSEAAVVEPTLVIEDIHCEGNKSTSCDFIRGFIKATPGDQVEEASIENAKLRLMAVPNFKSVATRLEKGSERGRVILVIQVEEGSPIVSEISSGMTVIRKDSHQQGFSSEIGGRVSHQNVFGAGRILELEFNHRNENETEGKDLKYQSFATRIQYIDPNLFQSDKFYLILGGQNILDKAEMGTFNATDSTQLVDIAIGRRFGDFSHFAVKAGLEFFRWQDFTEKKSLDDQWDRANILRGFSYGWNSEDDPYFPTQGSKFEMDFSWKKYSPLVVGKEFLYKDNLTFMTSFQKTWSLTNSRFLTFRLGNPHSEFQSNLRDQYAFLALRYSQDLQNSVQSVNRGRWYIEPQFDSVSYSSLKGMDTRSGLRSGISIEHKTFGLINLFGEVKIVESRKSL